MYQGRPVTLRSIAFVTCDGIELSLLYYLLLSPCAFLAMMDGNSDNASLHFPLLFLTGIWSQWCKQTDVVNSGWLVTYTACACYVVFPLTLILSSSLLKLLLSTQPWHSSRAATLENPCVTNWGTDCRLSWDNYHTLSATSLQTAPDPPNCVSLQLQEWWEDGYMLLLSCYVYIQEYSWIYHAYVFLMNVCSLLH